MGQVRNSTQRNTVILRQKLVDDHYRKKSTYLQAKDYENSEKEYEPSWTVEWNFAHRDWEKYYNEHPLEKAYIIRKAKQSPRALTFADIQRLMIVESFIPEKGSIYLEETHEYTIESALDMARG